MWNSNRGTLDTLENRLTALELKLEAFMSMVQRSQNTVIEAAQSTMMVVEVMNGRLLAINTLLPILLLHIAELEGRLDGAASHSDDVGARARSLLVETYGINQQSTMINTPDSLSEGFGKFMEMVESIIATQHLRRKLAAGTD